MIDGDQITRDNMKEYLMLGSDQILSNIHVQMFEMNKRLGLLDKALDLFVERFRLLSKYRFLTHDEYIF